MRSRLVLVVGTLAVLGSASVLWAQPGGGRGRPGGGAFGGGGFGMGRLFLLRLEAVQKELELMPDQIEAIRKLQEELRGDRGGQFNRSRRGGGQRGRGGQGDRGGQGERRGQGRLGTSMYEQQRGEFFVQADDRGGRRSFRDMSDEERQKMIEEFRKRAAERAKQEKEKLGEILLPHQMKRLNEIYIQVLGVRALQDPEVAKELGITDKQSAEMEKVRNDAREKMRSEMQSLFQSGDRDKIREKMTKVREEIEKKVLAVLTAQQQKKFDQMKGEPFKLPEDAFRGGFGGRGGRGPGGQGQGGRGPGRRGPGGEGGSRRPASDS